ncbi:DMT family transporter [Paenibacillus sp. SYP-B3998]|uniref:DMT family transporter n=1 Tax=Paenibacillus sp. SYP-B3998 TaxID=2678564 RepID=A0A6G3ZYU8_9BACL|nr:DMT family transporter [Paenibacillus sp. SYP-B3998]NEW06751.1 DMT family transporter [Paenibacillus sp. SYP-B3998]
MKKNTVVVGVLYCLISVLAWGGMFPVMRVALQNMDPFYFTTIRYLAAGLVFLILLAIFEGKKAFRLEDKTWKLLFFGAAGFSGFGFLVFAGQKLSGPSGAIIASVMMALMPLMTVFVNWGVKKVKPTSFNFISILIALTGSLLVITNGDFSVLLQAKSNLFADLLILLGALCWVIYTMGGGQFVGWSPLRYTTLTTCFGTLVNILIVALGTALGLLTIPSLDKLFAATPELLYMILIAGVLAVFTWNVGNKILKPTNGVLFMNIVPVTTVTISMIQGVGIGAAQLTGILIVISALVMNNLIQRWISRTTLSSKRNSLKIKDSM